MSATKKRTDTGRSDAEAKTADAAARRSSGQDAAYDVGYGKPPQATRFRKGRSGNPAGRPRKRKAPTYRYSDAPSDEFLADEIYRNLTLRENGEAVELPAMRAVIRANIMGALKGNRLSQKYLIEKAEKREFEREQLKWQRYEKLAKLKRDGEQILEEHRKRGTPPPELVPHPDDIVLEPSTGDVSIDGPQTQEEVRFWKHSSDFRDHLVMRAVHAEKTGQGPKITLNGQTVCFWFFAASWIDCAMPRRLRWEEHQPLLLWMRYKGLPKRTRERIIKDEGDRLKRTAPRHLHLTGETREIWDRYLRGMEKRAAAAGAAASSTGAGR